MAETWKTVWTASMQGPYPVGNAFAQPDLSQALPDPSRGAVDQSMRMIVRPDRWGGRARLRFSNVFGTEPLRLECVRAGLHIGGGAVDPETVVPVAFAGADAASAAAGGDLTSDAFELPFAERFGDAGLYGRELAVSFHVTGASGPMTWHAKAMRTSYLGRPGGGSCCHEAGDTAFPFATTSWFYLCAVDMAVAGSPTLVVAFGDSLTEGANSTMNGQDRWPDILSRRLRGCGGDGFIVVNAGIGGNEVTGPARYTIEEPYCGGPSALSRLERDVLSLTGVDTVMWLQGINDFRHPEVTARDLWRGMQTGIALMRSRSPKLRVVGATVPTCVGCTIGDHGSMVQEQNRRDFNALVREGGLFDAWFDFDAATRNPDGVGLHPDFIPGSNGGPGDGLHPNRAGYQAMAALVDPGLLLA